MAKQELEKIKEENKYELTKLDNFHSVEEMLKFAEVLIKSGLVPSTLSKPEKLVAVIQQGRELGIPAVSAMNNIHNIQGKATLGVHAFTALARKHYVDWEMQKDCLYIFEDGFEHKLITPNITKEHGNYIDKICEIKFYRWNEKLKRTIENTLSFSISEADKQGLMTKDNWKKMPNIMLRSRTLVLGIRFVASDVFMGIYETSEMLDANNKTYDIDEEGNVINM